MKLLVTVVQDKDRNRLQNALMREDFHATKLASTGGFLRSGNTTFLIGTEDERLDEVLELIKEHCSSRKQTAMPFSTVDGSTDGYMMQPVEVEVGGATVFVLDVDQFLHF